MKPRKRDGGDDKHCATINGAFQFTPDGGWQGRNFTDQQHCQEIFCTKQPGSKIDISQIQGSPGQNFSVNGFWPGKESLFSTIPGNASQAFVAQVDGIPVDLAHHADLDLNNNKFAIVGILGNRDGEHSFELTNLQNQASVCVYEAILGPPGPNSPIPSSPTSPIGSPTFTSSSPGQTSNSPSVSGSSNGTTNGPKPGQIAAAVIIPILVVVCLLFFTLYLRRRWRHQKVSVPLPSEGLKLDEPDRMEAGATKAWSPSQSPFFQNTPIPRPGRQAAPARRGRHFATFTLSSVSSIPQPPPSVNPPSTVSESRTTIFDRAQATLGRLASVRAAPDSRRGVLRAVNVGDE